MCTCRTNVGLLYRRVYRVALSAFLCCPRARSFVYIGIHCFPFSRVGRASLFSLSLYPLRAREGEKGAVGENEDVCARDYVRMRNRDWIKSRANPPRATGFWVESRERLVFWSWITVHVYIRAIWGLFYANSGARINQVCWMFYEYSVYSVWERQPPKLRACVVELSSLGRMENANNDEFCRVQRIDYLF